ncbi:MULTISPECIES: sensor histidine kinase [Geobacillus]|jgi:two-component system sensor histidine kinase DegS|uniref:sensor histidine kinase n=1 Tax=Geobacillus TaxID=129337 RepID=UPI00017E4E97|nr:MULTISPECIES: sensor histidine kinase [Geobacillus]ATO37840.1 histidine kinase [Geobacillus thermodenitrificans]MEC5187926.1 two-component system sensor histidine kinase DegS [Geobacillus thermodenitrificans]MED0663159.1 histidine kinase [Geobacillus thermodenitrificans]MED3719184.1 sensor histidine kinase [Geobacillus thermodenitrificans]MED3906337.1 sensor histidine kinase [Geobacillus thermodenitrificans]
MAGEKRWDEKYLDKIVEKMIDTVQHSKDEIFRIGEQSRQEQDCLLRELEEVKWLTVRVIEEVDQLEVKARQARRRLSEVSQHFSSHSEQDIREAYEVAHEMHMKLAMVREQEKQLRLRRDELERRLASLIQIIERSDHLVGQITVVLNYLNSDFRQVSEIIEGAKQKQEFGLKIIEAQEEERRRLSREIHDGPAQLLAHVLLRSDLVEKVMKDRGTEAAIAEIRDFRKMVRSALSEVRRIIYDLRPMALDDLGLVPTLKKYLQTTEEYNKGVHISFVHMGEETRLPSRMEVAVFRLVQESVQNALKHAEASQIDVKMEVTCRELLVSVKDNGKGFDPSVKKENAFGLIGMRERVELLGGTLTIRSTIGGGTIVFIRVPIDRSVLETANKEERKS